MKDCSGCGKRKELVMFYVDRSKSDGYSNQCKDCVRAYQAKRRERLNADRPAGWKTKTADIVAYRKAWRAAHPGYATRMKAEWLKSHPDKRREKEKRQYANKMKRLHGEDYVVGSPENKKGHGDNRRVLTPEEASFRHSVRRKAQRAVRVGKLVRQPCSVCGEVNSEGHHHDYSKPFDVIWLCKTHHREAHKSCNTQ